MSSAGLHWERCPKRTRIVHVRNSEFGRFLGCDGYPDCEFTKDLDAEARAILDSPGDDERQCCLNPDRVATVTQGERSNGYYEKHADGRSS
jgi:DNA topoisomerase I